MRTFDYQHLPKGLFGGKVGDAHVRLFEDKGKLETMKQIHPKVFEALEEHAFFDSIESSTRIEGLYPDSARVQEIALHTLRSSQDLPNNPTDALNSTMSDLDSQVAGYAWALHFIQTHSSELRLSTSMLIALFEALFGHRGLGNKSRYRKKDYLYVQVDGHPQAMPVSPITAFETPLVLGGACDSLAESFDAQACSPLVLNAVFTVDFLCIRPFDEGNGRIARLFSDLMLHKAGFGVSRYMSIDRIIEESAMDYYDALNACVNGWDTSTNNYAPYALYWFDVLHEAHEKLFRAVDIELRAGNSKAERVRLFVEQASRPISKRQIIEALGNVSEATVEAVLGQMVKEGAVQKTGSGRATKYLAR